MKRYIVFLLICIFITTNTSAFIQNQSTQIPLHNAVEFVSTMKNTQQEETQLIPFCYHNQTFSISPNEIALYQAENTTTITLENSIPFNQPDLPLIPMKTITISLPKDIIIHEIEFSEESIQYYNEPFSFDITPTPQFWSVNETPLHQHTDEIIQETINAYQERDYYPGRSHSYIVGENTTNTTIILYLFPIQYNLNTKGTYIIEKGTFSVAYEKQTETIPSATSTDLENIIITPPRFYVQAQKLKQHHESEGIPTKVITTTMIKATNKPSTYPDIMGYKDFTFRERIPRFDSVLARKIISYLQDQASNTQLKCVTILGSAEHVPPSYYFGYSYYPVPTDFYYSSPDLDLIPNYCVGRIPAHSILDAIKMVNKIIEWSPPSSQMNNIALAGGIPFNTPYFIGELMTIDSVNRGIFDGYSVDKYYRSDDRFNKDDILNALEGEHSLLFMICHGSPFLIAVEEGRISTKDMDKMKKNTHEPIISCIACSSGSYDTYIIKQGRRIDKTSFAESVLLSKGGGIAYIGGARTNDGYPLFSLDQGRVVTTKETYLGGLLTYVNQAYSQTYNQLGELTKHAAETYLEHNEMNEFWNLYHYFGFVLLGDPALILPERTPDNPSYYYPKTSSPQAVGYVDYRSNDEFYNGTIIISAIDEKSSYNCHTNSPQIAVKQIETGDYQNLDVQIETYTSTDELTSIPITATAGELTLLRFETNDGKEEWVYYQPVRPVDDDFSSKTPGINTTRWNKIQAAVDMSNPEDTIFVFKGIYNETLFLIKPCHLTGEHSKHTIIDGQSHDNVITVLSEGITISDLTIQHCGNNQWDAAILIQPKKCLKPEPITITENQIINNKNCGIYIDTLASLFSPSISIVTNLIAYNNHGIYTNTGTEDITLSENRIFGNNIGLYLKDSQKNTIDHNTIENNGVGTYLELVTQTQIQDNNFIENSQHCQFTMVEKTTFTGNYWDNWIGHLFKRDVRLPKIINGFHTQELELLSQIKIDRHPSNHLIE